MLDPALVTSNPQDVLKQFKSSLSGLDDSEVQKRRIEYGANTIVETGSSWKSILVRQFKSSFIYLLIAACAISIIYGEYLDAVIIFMFLTINTVLGFYQEFHSEKTIKLLRNFIRTNVTVNRNGQHQRIQVEDLIPGDIVHLSAGDLIPADVRFFNSSGLTLDESIVTGESVPVLKVHEAGENPKDPVNIGFSGTTVVSGKGSGVVIATGGHTSYADIAKLVAKTMKKTIFEKEIEAISKFTLTLIAVTLVFIFFVHVAIKGETDIAKLALFSAALAVSVIPEALPLVTTFSLSIGAMQLAKQKVVVKRLTAIEDLGSIEILCSDKTGTLTENRLTFTNSYGKDKDAILFYESLAVPDANGGAKDPFDIAILTALGQSEKRKEYQIFGSLPFDPEHKRTTVIVRHENEYELISRGAPEAIKALCRNLKADENDEITSWISREGIFGRRVLAVARKKVSEQTVDMRESERDMEFLGMLSFVDPIKPTAQEAVSHAKKLGVSIKILTGDSREVAASVASQVGLISDFNDVITGNEFDGLGGGEQRQALERFNVFARVTPVQKHAIVQLLESEHEVGFLGEGINDAPALKASNVAIAVAGAADIAREASDIVLLEKSLNVIVNGIEQGRRVFVNTTKYITATLSANFGNFFAVVLVSLIIPFLPLLPLQILLLNLLSDFPMIAVATDTVDISEIQKPQRYNIKNFAVFALLLGIVSTVFDFLFFAVFWGKGESILQTNWFMGSVLTELLFIFSVRTRKFLLFGKKPSGPLIVLSVIAAVITISLPYFPLGQKLFLFQMPSVSDITTIGFILFFYVAATEGMKRLYFKLRLDMKIAHRNSVA